MLRILKFVEAIRCFRMNVRSKVFLASCIPLSSVAFFNPLGLIDEQKGKFIFFCTCCVVIFCLLFIKTPRIRGNYPKTGYFLLALSMVTALYSAVNIHGQPFVISLIAIATYIFAYGTFFLFYKLNIPRCRFGLIIRTLCILAIIVYISNVVTYPYHIFGDPEHQIGERGGILRVRIPFIELIILIFLYNIDRIASKGGNKKSLIWLIISGMMILFSLTRQVIITSFVVGSILYLYKKRGASRLVWTIAILFFTLVIIPQTSIYKIIVETTEAESKRTRGMENNIRVEAWKFYTITAQESVKTMILGNGVPSLHKSNWGRHMNQEMELRKTFVGDVGWAGFFFYFGFIGVLGISLILIDAYKRARRNKQYWINAWIIFIAITSVASGQITYHYQIVSICMVLYLVYKKSKYKIITVKK